MHIKHHTPHATCQEIGHNRVLSDAQEGIHAGPPPLQHGPFTIESHLGGNVHLVEKDHRIIKIHGNELKPARGIPPVATFVPNLTVRADQLKANSPIHAVSTRDLLLSPPTQVSPVPLITIDSRPNTRSTISAVVEESPNLTETSERPKESSLHHPGTYDCGKVPSSTVENLDHSKGPIKRCGRPQREKTVQKPSPNPLEPRYNLRSRNKANAMGKK